MADKAEQKAVVITEVTKTVTKDGVVKVRTVRHKLKPGQDPMQWDMERRWRQRKRKPL